MKAGDTIQYVSESSHSGKLVATDGKTAEFAINSAGRIAKPNIVVPVEQILTAGVQIGEVGQFKTKTIMNGKVNKVYTGAVDVTPIHSLNNKFPASFLVAATAVISVISPR